EDGGRRDLELGCVRRRRFGSLVLEAAEDRQALDDDVPTRWDLQFDSTEGDEHVEPRVRGQSGLTQVDLGPAEHGGDAPALERLGDRGDVAPGEHVEAVHLVCRHLVGAHPPAHQHEETDDDERGGDDQVDRVHHTQSREQEDDTRHDQDCRHDPVTGVGEERNHTGEHEDDRPPDAEDLAGVDQIRIAEKQDHTYTEDDPAEEDTTPVHVSNGTWYSVLGTWKESGKGRGPGGAGASSKYQVPGTG